MPWYNENVEIKMQNEGSDRMREKKKRRLLAVYSCGHFLIDLTSAFLMFSLSCSGEESLFAVILYNFFAFAVQMPTGLIADRLDRNGVVASFGLVLALAAFPLTQIPILCAVVLGLGNCLYHVGGGVDVLGFDDEKQWMLGVFVSPGAAGLFIGTFLAKSGTLSVTAGAVIISLLSAAVILALHLTYSLGEPSGNSPVSMKMTGKMSVFAVILLFLVVVLRSYVGLTLYTPWKNGTLFSVLSLSGLVLGKAAGGFLADRFGAVRTACVSLLLSSVLFIFSENAVCGILAIFLFNMTMPLTLYEVSRIFPHARGFSFGLLTFALFLGCVPSFLSLPVPFYGEVWFHSVEAAVSLVLLTAGLLLSRERMAK